MATDPKLTDPPTLALTTTAGAVKTDPAENMTKLSKLIEVNVLTLGFHGKMTNPDLPVAEAEHLPGSEVVLVLVDVPELDELVSDELDESPEELAEVPEDEEESEAETTEASDELDDVPDELLDDASDALVPDELVPDDEDELVSEVPDDDELEEESEVPVEAESEEVAVPVASCLAILQ